MEDLARRIEAADEQCRELDALPSRIVSRLSIDQETGCWNWTSPNSLIGRGRGYVSINGRPMIHHRAVWTLLRGAIPSGAYLCHHCDNPKCANPTHLYVGDSKTNVADMVSRGRHWAQQQPERSREGGRRCGRSNNWVKGENNPRAKLTEDQVSTIVKSEKGPTALAREYGVHRTTIQRIRKGNLWR